MVGTYSAVETIFSCISGVPILPKTWPWHRKVKKLQCESIMMSVLHRGLKNYVPSQIIYPQPRWLEVSKEIPTQW